MDKQTECVKVWMDERLFADLSRLAHRDDRKLSEFIRCVLSDHVYGHIRADVAEAEGPMRD